MLRVRADIRFPMPAALAFLAVGAHHVVGIFVASDLKLRNITKLSERFEDFFTSNPI